MQLKDQADLKPRAKAEEEEEEELLELLLLPLALLWPPSFALAQAHDLLRAPAGVGKEGSGTAGEWGGAVW